MTRSYESQRVFREFNLNAIEIEKTCGQIAHLDEILTMSARMCAASGNLAWKARYEEHVPILEDRLERAYQLAAGTVSAGGRTQTEGANRRLLELEAEAFELVVSGRREEALERISSLEYETNKVIIAARTSALLQAFQAHVSAAWSAQQLEQQQIMIGAAVAVLALLLLWWRVAVSMRRFTRERDAHQADLTRHTTELKQSNRELERASAIAEGASQAKGSFVATISHELRTPMNGVIGCATLLADSELNDEQQEYVKAIQASGEILLGLINDVLDFSKIEAGKMTLEMVPDQPERVVSQVHGIMLHTAKTKGLEFSYEVADDVPETVMIDAGRLSQILTNLVGNAIKFTSKGFVSIELTCRSIENGEAALNFAVRDSGIGMSRQGMDMLFSEFTQAEASTTRRFGGTGLGLSISQRIAEMMGGDIRVDSVEGEGSTFEVSIFAEVVTAQQAVEVSFDPFDEAFSATILLVEDNLTNQVVATRLMQKLGLDVIVASNGAVALEKLDSTPIDLIFMDCQMPVMDGFEATRVIRASERAYRTIPIVALTANAREEDLLRCLAAGMTDHLTKPVKFAELRDTIERFLVDAEIDSAAA